MKLAALDRALRVPPSRRRVEEPPAPQGELHAHLGDPAAGGPLLVLVLAELEGDLPEDHRGGKAEVELPDRQGHPPRGGFPHEPCREVPLDPGKEDEDGGCSRRHQDEEGPEEREEGTPAGAFHGLQPQNSPGEADKGGDR